MKKQKHTAGSSLIEIIMVMMLFILFGLTTYTLIHAGGEAQAKIIAERDAQLEARVAINYINVRLKQNDVRGMIAVYPDGGPTGQNAILIKERGAYDFDTWIFHSNGVLKEALVFPGDPPNDRPGMYKAIAHIEDFSVMRQEDGTLLYIVTYISAGRHETLERVVALRAGTH